MKDIVIMNSDSMSIKDKTNVEPKKIKMIHEQEFEAYGINPEEVYKDGIALKPLNPEWIPEILIENVNSIKINRSYQNINKAERTITLGFDTEETCQKFNQEFNQKLFSTINNFIRRKNENPISYNRVIVFETLIEKFSYIIRY